MERRHALIAIGLGALVIIMGGAHLVLDGSSKGVSIPDGEVVYLTAGSDTIRAETARTWAEKQQGLQGRVELGHEEGMLFVFDDDQRREFWMKETYIPLDLVALDRNMKILEVIAMAPLDTTIHKTRHRARFALEVRQGFLERYGMKVGDRLDVVDDLDEASRR